VFSSPTATLEVVGNTGNMSSEKAGVGGFADDPQVLRIMGTILAKPTVRTS
jgi:hypothetical protein